MNVVIIQGKQNQTRVEPALDDVEDGVTMETNPMTAPAAQTTPVGGGGEGGGQLGSNTSLQKTSPSTLIHAAAVNGDKTSLQKLLTGKLKYTILNILQIYFVLTFKLFWTEPDESIFG